MDSQDQENSTRENRVMCSCSSTCSTKRGRNTNRGCPCKTEGLPCGPDCKCGSTTKPCRNKPGGTNQPASAASRRSQPYSNEATRPSEEEERVKENNDVKEFIQTLDDPMVRKLCIRSLRRGTGSMDYIHGLLLMEDDLDEEHDGSTNASHSGPTSGDLISVEGSNSEPGPSGSTTSIARCKCGVCQIMPQEVENKCCGQRRCVTTHTRLSKLCLDPDVLQLAIRNRETLGMTGTITAQDHSGKLVTDNMSLIAMATLEKEIGKCALPVLSKLYASTIRHRLESIWDLDRSEKNYWAVYFNIKKKHMQILV